MALSVLWAAAEAFSAAGISVGGGVNNSFTNSSGDGYSPRTSYNAGVAMEGQLAGEWLSLAPGASLETRGEKGEFDGTEATLKFLYLQAPLHLKVRIPVGPAFFDAFVGPSVGFPVVAEMEVHDGGGSRTENLEDVTAFLDFGIETGVGLEFPAGSGYVFVQGSLYNGWTTPLDWAPDTRWRTAQLRVGFRFPLPGSSSESSPLPPPPPPPPAPPPFYPDP